ncbi:MAG: homoserine kinase [Hyphomicrobiales bacterium]|nr:homoserine kinase [Hyphomicrobiales bacterium]
MAVYTEVSAEDLDRLLAGYDLGTVKSCKGIAEGVENSNYLVHLDAGFFILTLYEKRVNADDLPFFLGLMRHLAARGLTCPQPVANRNGEILAEVAGRPAALVTFLDGLSVRRVTPVHCAGVGAALAQLHIAGADFALRRPNALALPGWQPLVDQAGARADEVTPGLAGTISAELAFLTAHWPHDLPQGVIHADLFTDNVFFLGEQLSGLIDFYFACNDALVYDLAICLNAWCFEPDFSFNITKGMAMIEAYRGVRALSAAEIAALPILSRGAALRFLLTRLVDWLNVPKGALVRPKDPKEYLRKLRFQQSVTGPRDYGLRD